MDCFYKILQKYHAVVLKWSLKRNSFLQRKSPIHYVVQYTLCCSICLHVASNPCVEKNFPVRISPYKNAEQDDESTSRKTTPSVLYSHAKYFFFSTIWKYRRLLIWLKTLNPKRYAAKYPYRKDGCVRCGLFLRNENEM